jgi:hypothetical protein
VIHFTTKENIDQKGLTAYKLDAKHTVTAMVHAYSSSGRRAALRAEPCVAAAFDRKERSPPGNI